ncbi:hypothetical protein ACFYWO_00945 [Streptomyces sp. NPDC002932]|uniref:hypothetical protein n=1 Tax=Streptomyces sp. NPDC002932 TaxID=3364672 RepID=UPI0036B64480
MFAATLPALRRREKWVHLGTDRTDRRRSGARSLSGGDRAVVAADVRAALEREVAAVHARYLSAMDQADQNEDPTGVAAVFAYGALQTVQEALPEFRHSALPAGPDRRS